jgi:hypothetical protein
MYSRKFTVIFHLLVTMLLINCVTSADEDATASEDAHESLMTTESRQLFVATTPKIAARHSTGDDR